jgi:penicillin-binding protein 1C
MAAYIYQLHPLNISKPYSTAVYDRNGVLIHILLSKDDKWRLYCPISELDSLFLKIIIEKEDKYFRYHPGVNLLSVSRALLFNMLSQKTTSGASTITMQVARLLNPKERTLGNKIIEMFHAFYLEWKLSKSEILELYLNLVPYGGNIEGIKAASLLYYGKNPNHISLAQSVVLSIVPNKPISWSIKKSAARLLKARNTWLAYYRSQQLISDTNYYDALKEPLGLAHKGRPKDIPHLALRLISKANKAGIVNSSIDSKTQKLVEQLAEEQSKKMSALAIYNLSVLVVHNKSREVLCYIGSQNFNDAKFGQIDGVKTYRSPGSTLKPLVYALAFDKGIYTPQSTITDVPSDFDGYSPENYDKKFSGLVSVEKALSYSLNIPAVKTLLAVGRNDFQQLLYRSRFKKFSSKHPLGLSLILGGCETNLEQLVSMYVALANGGKYQTLKTASQNYQANQKQLVSAESAYMINHILSQMSRPDLPHNAIANIHIPHVAWKTGTSYGRRDAWCIGYNTDYTVGVWLGNFDNKGVPELSGADLALPFMFSIFNQIDYNSHAHIFTKPFNLGERLVCAHTGKVPSSFCTEQVNDYFIKGISDASVCKHIKKVYVSSNESMSYCTHCLPQSEYKTKQYIKYPPELIQYYNSNGIAYTQVPPHNHRCTGILANDELKILSPLAGKTYLIEAGDKAEILLKCQAAYDVNKVFWYVNNQFYKSSSPQQGVFFYPSVGHMKISCADDKGNHTDIEISVQEY